MLTGAYCLGTHELLDQSIQWSAVHTRYQHERTALALLELKGFRTFCPTYNAVHRWKDRKKTISLPLFPGYFFVGDASERKLEVVSTPGICAILSQGGVPAIIPSEVIAAIHRTVLNPSKVEPHPFLNQGDRVRVIFGPLSGVEGILVRKKDAYRLVVSVEILGRAAAVEIDASHVERTTRALKTYALGGDHAPGAMPS